MIVDMQKTGGLMGKTVWKKVFLGFLPVLMIISILFVQTAATDVANASEAELKWTESPKTIVLKPGKTEEGLAYRLSISGGLLKTSGTTISFNLGLPKGVALSDGGMEGVGLSVDGGWEIAGQQTVSASAFDVVLRKDEPETPVEEETEPEASADETTEQAEPEVSADETTEQAEPEVSVDEPEAPVTLTLTIPAGTFSVGESFAQGDIILTAVSEGVEVSAVTEAKPEKSDALDPPGEGETPKDSDPPSEGDIPENSNEPSEGDTLEDPDTPSEGDTPDTPDEGDTPEEPAPDKGNTLDEPDEPEWEVTEKTGFGTTVFWVDNNNEAGRRMPKEELSEAVSRGISFTLAGKTYPLNEENMKLLGMTSLPRATVRENGINTYDISYPNDAFPTKLSDKNGMVTTDQDITWNFIQPERDGYDAVEVNAGNIDNYPSLKVNGEPYPYGWYYILKAPFSFDVVLRTGASYNSSGNLKSEDLKNAVLDNFKLVITRPNNPTLVELPLSAISSDPDSGFEFKVNEGAEGDSEADRTEAAKTATITVTNGWKYNINGAPMGYKIVQNVPEDSDEKGQITAPPIHTGDAPVGVGEDQLKITYDNTGTNYASETDGTHQGGKLYLTLKGEAAYKATKEWNDQGVQDVKRPKATLELWRYRNGQDYQSATPVRDSNNDIVKAVIEADSTESTKTIEFKASDIDTLRSLPKYDPEGYRYVYVVKEYLEGEHANQYKQVFGKVTEEPEGSGQFKITDTLPNWLPGGAAIERDENNKYVYNGGTLSNCLDVDTNVKATKTWKAASFQADFKNVIVELTLQSRPKNLDGTVGEWSNATSEDGKAIRRVKYGFGEEDLSAWAVDASGPKYGLLGRELEYRWVETAVYQAPDSIGAYTEENLKKWYESEETKTNLLNTDGSFTLKQSKETVAYRSTAETIEVDKEQVQIITNRMENTIDYEMEKQWENMEPHEVTFSLFRIKSGGTLSAGTPAYVTFAMDKTGEIVKFTPPDDAPSVSITNPEGQAWKALIENLPKYDENGALYQYTLLENGGLPSYQLQMDQEGNYHMVVINAPGLGQRIMVCKEWADGSDVAHREPVTIEVHEKGTDKLINTVTLTGDGEWSSLVGIPDEYKLENVYIKEVSIGSEGHEKEVSYPASADWTDPAGITGTYTSDYHNYEVTYRKETVLGETVYTARNRRVNTVNLTVEKLWKDNNGMLRQKLQEGLEKLPEDKQLALSLRLKFAGDYEENQGYVISRTGITAGSTGDTVSAGTGLTPRPIWDDQGNPAASVQKIDFGGSKDLPAGSDKWNQYTNKYYFWNLPKYDVTGAVMHYTVEEVWLDKAGNIPADFKTLDEYLKTNLAGYPESYRELEELVKEYSFSVTDESYIVGEAEDEGAEAQVNTAYLRAKTIVPDQQTIELTNRLSGTKTVYWHKLWDDAYVYSQGNRPDIYLDIFRLVHKEDANGNLQQVIEPYMRDYRWDSSTDSSMTGIIDGGNKKNHWHAVLDNLPKYDEETGREYYYYAVERAKVNIKQFDYADVTYYYGKDIGTAGDGGTTGDDSDTKTDIADWPDTMTGNMVKISLAREPIEGGDERLAFGYNAPAKIAVVPEDMKAEVPPYKHYQYPNNMLLEGGYFSNTLSNNVIIEGRKLWQALPNSYPAADLPAIKFSVYQSVQTTVAADAGGAAGINADPKGTFVATITVDKWTDENIAQGTYLFQILCRTNEKGEYIDSAGNVVTDIEAAAPLPQYDEKGRRYIYTLVEDEITWADGTTTKVSGESSGTSDERTGLFDTTQPGEKNFIASNAYVGVKGSLAVKKILKLEKKVLKDTAGNLTEQYVYPSVKFRLERYYYSKESNNTVKDNSFLQEKTWESTDIRAAHTGAGDDVIGTITFGELEKYAPNGSEYLYTVTEVTEDFLKGYDTWVLAGDKGTADFDDDTKVDDNKKTSISGLKVTVDTLAAPGTGTAPGTSAAPDAAATFLNEYHTDRKPLVIQKVWDDYEDVFGLRPDTIKAELYRYTDSQPGQNNGIGQSKLAEITLLGKTTGSSIKFETSVSEYTSAGITITFEKNTENNWQWTLTDFEQYAPNGMPWKYVIKEVDTGTDKHYQFSPAEAKGSWNTNYEEYTVSKLTNSIYTNVPFKKVWKDADDHIITGNYLGPDLTVTFALQVQEEGSTDWQNAGKYFEDNLEPAALAKVKDISGCADDFTKIISKEVNDTAGWSSSFSKLPTVIKKKNAGKTTVKLSYRVVETKVKYGNSEQEIIVNKDGTYSIAAGGGLVTDADFVTENGVSVTTNKLDTTSLKIQKRWKGDNFNQYKTRPGTDKKGYTWETAFVLQRSADNGNTWETVTKTTLYGKNVNPWAEETIAGLPARSPEGNVYTYRARELEPGTDTIIEKTGDGYYKDTYTASYDETTSALTVTNTLKEIKDPFTTYAAEKKWYPDEKPDTEAARTATLALQYLAQDNTGTVWKTLAEVKLDGVPDNNLSTGTDVDGKMAYGEDAAWHAVWKDVPLKHPDSYLLPDDPRTTYRVIELECEPDDYIAQRDEDVKTEGEICTFTFYNIQPTSLAVEKKWAGVEEAKQKEAVVGLYRTTTEGDIGSDKGTAVTDEKDVPMTLSLTARNGWSGTFDQLPAYDTEGNPYYYYALEQSIGGEPVDKSGFIASYDHTTMPGTTVITNVQSMSVDGTKTWLDGNNQDGKRPKSLTLTLERSLDGILWESVDAKPEWTDTSTNVWKYSYNGLPKTDLNGAPYRYRVTETIPKEYNGKTEEFDFTNTLTDITDFKVTKKWVDDNGKGRPDSLALTLYRSTDGFDAGTKEEVADAAPMVDKSAGSQWIFTYTGLPKYDSQGARYTYWVEETVPEGYQTEDQRAQDDGVLENVQKGTLKVSKTVSGNRGDTNKEFRFQVTLSGISTAGIHSEDVTGRIAVYENGALVKGNTREFAGGKVEFRLKHGQTAVITGLPAGLEYTVTELDANQNGYKTTSTGDSGKIPAGTAAAEFVNRKSDRSHKDDSSDSADPGNPGAPVGPPMTNDPANPVLWLIICLISLGVILAFAGRKRRKKKDSE